MLFFIKPSKVVLDCYTTNSSIAEYFPVQKATSFLPDWWKKIPGSYKDRVFPTSPIEVPMGTIKRCEGFVQLYKNSLILPLWSEVIIKTGKDGSWNYIFSSVDQPNSLQTSIMSHPSEQVGNNFENYIHMKMLNPVLMVEKKGIHFHWTSPWWNTYNMNHPIIPPGIVDYKHQHGAHINMFFDKKDAEYNFKSGEPMVMMTPLTEKEVIVKTHVVDTFEYEKYRQLNGYEHSFVGKYRKNKKAIDSKTKCPFGFGK